MQTLPRHLGTIAMLLACSRLAHAAPLPAELLGTWGLSEAAADLLAPNCRSMTFRFDPEFVTLTSGDMVLTTRSDLDPDAPPLTLRQVVTAFNLRPNCIGTLMPYALGQRIPDLRLELQGDRLRLQLIERRGSPRQVELVRSSLPAGHAAASPGPVRPTVTVAHRTDPGAAMKCPQPEYPEVAEREGAQGVTRIRFTVDAQGMATRPEITNSAGDTRAHRVLDRAAVEALGKCEIPLDKTTPGTAMVVDYVWRLPGLARSPGQ
jgi:protein TonB